MAMTLSSHKKDIQEHFDRLAPHLDSWKAKNPYYHETQTRFFRFLIPPGRNVLELGSGTGELLAAIEPVCGTGIEISAAMVARAKERFPHQDSRWADAENPETWKIGDKTFDYIVMADLVGYLEDVQATFENLRRFCAPSTKIVISYYNFLWEPAFKLAERLGLKTPTATGNWLAPEDLANLLELADFDTVKTERRFLIPKRIPFIGKGLEFLGSLPVINKLCICNYIVARPRTRLEALATQTVSVIVPCRNEEGNIATVAARVPAMGAHTELIFVEGNSRDRTLDEIHRAAAHFPDKDIKCIQQDGSGKGDAVRKGFQQASGEILMILDADLTVAPEDLPKFYDAIVSGKGELINGCRLVYPMEKEAMRSLNIIGNKFFSLIFTWLLNQRIKDTLCGTKVLKKNDYERIAANRVYFGDFDPFGDFDLLFGASKLNLKIIEIPVRYGARKYGETQISRFQHGFLLFKMCIFAVRKLKLP